jgi:hypothetical protein
MISSRTRIRVYQADVPQVHNDGIVDDVLDSLLPDDSLRVVSVLLLPEVE